MITSEVPNCLLRYVSAFSSIAVGTRLGEPQFSADADSVCRHSYSVLRLYRKPADNHRSHLEPRSVHKGSLILEFGPVEHSNIGTFLMRQHFNDAIVSFCRIRLLRERRHKKTRTKKKLGKELDGRAAVFELACRMSMHRE